MAAIRFDRVVASIDGSDIVIAFFCEQEPEPVCSVRGRPGAAFHLMKEVCSALDTGAALGIVDAEM